MIIKCKFVINFPRDGTNYSILWDTNYVNGCRHASLGIESFVKTACTVSAWVSKALWILRVLCQPGCPELCEYCLYCIGLGVSNCVNTACTVPAWVPRSFCILRVLRALCQPGCQVLCEYYVYCASLCVPSFVHSAYTVKPVHTIEEGHVSQRVCAQRYGCPGQPLKGYKLRHL